MYSCCRNTVSGAVALLATASAVSSSDFQIDMNKTPCAAWNAFQYYRSIGEEEALEITVTKVDSATAAQHRQQSCGNTEASKAKDVANADGGFQPGTDLAASCDEFPPASVDIGGKDGGANIMIITTRENTKAGAGFSAKTGSFKIKLVNWDADAFKAQVGSGNWQKTTGVDQPLSLEPNVGWCYYDPE